MLITLIVYVRWYSMISLDSWQLQHLQWIFRSPHSKRARRSSLSTCCVILGKINCWDLLHPAHRNWGVSEGSKTKIDCVRREGARETLQEQWQTNHTHEVESVGVSLLSPAMNRCIVLEWALTYCGRLWIMGALARGDEHPVEKSSSWCEQQDIIRLWIH